MSFFKHIGFAAILLLVVSQTQAMSVTVESRFYQGGFDGGGSISGFFRGTDLDGDGQIYAASPFLSSILSVPFGNELDYAELTFTNMGTTLGAQTLVYDKSVADVSDMSNFFFGFAYNIGGGVFGDESNEGMSFSPFAPSTNYLLGEAFLGLFIDSIDPADQASFGACNGINACAAVLELVPDATSTSGIRTFSQNLSSSVVNVSGPLTFGLFSFVLLWLVRDRLSALK